jgi:hypothetical protein
MTSLGNNEVIMDELAVFFNVSLENLQEKGYGSSVDYGIIFILSLIFSGIIFAMFCLMNVFYPISRVKEIGVAKINGFKNIDIWQRLNASLFVFPTIFILISFIFQWILIKNVGIDYFLSLLFIQLLLLLLIMIFSLSTLFVIRKISISALLKNYFKFKYALYFSYLLKFSVFIGILLVIPTATQQIESATSRIKVYNAYKEIENKLTLTSLKQPEEELMKSIRGEEYILENKLIKLYQKLDDEEIVEYFQASSLKPQAFSADFDKIFTKANFLFGEEYEYVLANQQYLKNVSWDFATDIGNKYDKEKLTFFVPESFKKQEDKIQVLTRLIASSTLNLYDKKTLDDLPIMIHFYKENNQKLFTENIQMIEENKIFIKNPIFFQLESAYLAEGGVLTNSAISNPIRIENTPKNKKIISQAIKTVDLSENQLQFESLFTSGYMVELKEQLVGSFIILCVLAFAISISILASYYIILIILKSKNKEILVQKLIGYSMKDRYQTENYYFVLLYLFGMGQLLIFNRMIVSLILYLMLIFLDSGITYLMVQKHEKNYLSSALKGEEL